MNKFIFFISLCFFLLGKQNQSFAATHQNHFFDISIKSNPQILKQRIPLNDNLIVIVEETDLEEEFYNEEVKNDQNFRFFEKNFDSNNSYKSRNRFYPQNYFHTNLQLLPTLFIKLFPIYIKIGVFRI